MRRFASHVSATLSSLLRRERVCQSHAPDGRTLLHSYRYSTVKGTTAFHAVELICEARAETRTGRTGFDPDETFMRFRVNVRFEPLSFVPKRIADVFQPIGRERIEEA